MKKEDIIKKFKDINSKLLLSVLTYASTTVENLVPYIDNEEVDFGSIELIPEHDIYSCSDELKFINGLSKSYNTIWLDPIQVLESDGISDTFKLVKSRYVKVCRAISKGEIDFPEVYSEEGKIKLLNGRHRICAILSNCGNFNRLPFIIDKNFYDVNLDLGPLDNFDSKTNTLILK